MRALGSIAILVITVILWFLPITQGVYDFKTDPREDTFNNVLTGVGETTANVTILKALYDNDTSTFSISSNTSRDIPLYSSYNATTRELMVSGLAANITRSLYVTYDIDALSGVVAISTLLNFVPYFWYIILLLIPPVTLIAIWRGNT